MRGIKQALSLLMVGLALVKCVHAAERHPNIVFILADDLGYTDVACYGSKYYETPNIDRLAAEGARFTSGYTCGPNCQPTRAALMTGQYNPRTGIYTVGSIDRFNWQSRPLRPVDNAEDLPLDKTLLPQALKQAGYATGMFGKWHLGNKGEYHPARRGFDEAIVSAGAHFNFKTIPQQDVPEGTYLADYLTDKASDFIRRHRGERFFLYLPHYAVHAPHDAKPEGIEKFKPKPGAGGHKDPTYAAMIASVDESVGRIVALLDELKLADNTLVIFSSDNGGVGGYERLGIHGGSITDNAPLRGGKGMLSEGGIRVPYIFRWSGKIKPGIVDDTPINSVDLYPTLLEISGGQRPAGHVLDGASYAQLLIGALGTASRAPLFWHFPGYLGARNNTWRTTPAGAIRAGDWKLVEFFEDHHVELYDLKHDISEERNLAAANPERAAALQKQLADWRQSLGAKMPSPNEPETKQAAPGKKRRRQRE